MNALVIRPPCNGDSIDSRTTSYKNTMRGATGRGILMTSSSIQLHHGGKEAQTSTSVRVVGKRPSVNNGTLLFRGNINQPSDQAYDIR